MTALSLLATCYAGSHCPVVCSTPGLCAFGCGRRWQFATSNLGGHATCAVTTRFMLVLRDTIDSNPGLGFWKVAHALATNYQVVRRWYRHACELATDMPLTIKRPGRAA